MRKILKLIMSLLMVLSAAAYAQEIDRVALNITAAQMSGQMIACGGHPRFGAVQKYVREKLWSDPRDFNKLYQDFKNTREAARQQQIVGSKGVTCDDVKKRFDELADQFAVPRTE